MPAFAGLGAPHWDQHARGTILGLTRGTTVFGVCTDRLKNVPAKLPMGWEYPTPAPTLPQQYWIAQS